MFGSVRITCLGRAVQLQDDAFTVSCWILLEVYRLTITWAGIGENGWLLLAH